MTNKKRRFITREFTLSLLYRCIRGYSRTFRLKVENEHIWMDHMGNGGAFVLCCWHQQFFSAIRHFQNYRRYCPALMISKSTDGEIIAGVAKRTGWDPVRGSSSRGGKDALTAMIEKLKERKIAAHIVDGPRGPIGKIKPGAIRLAQMGGAVIVPFYTSADRAWHFNSWDRFMIPKPFSKVTLRYGNIFPVNQTMSEEEFEQQRLNLEKIMLDGLLVR
jgi:lysophospholipid acyltransferase (LPLAT)-like uncharacterized protein